ncbi:hypothetical protein B0H17DRAFT_1006591, partial [Mycena rosella]
MPSTTLITLALCFSVSAGPVRFAPHRSRAGAVADFSNAQLASELNIQFKNLTATSPCTTGQDACVKGNFAQCVGGKFVLQACGAGTICAAVPLATSPGTNVTCTTPDDLKTRIAAVSFARIRVVKF